MHNAALAQAGLSGWRYQLLPVPPELLAEVIPALPSAGFAGANVTIPHKEAALALATAPTERAWAIGAANTLTFPAAGETVADNTDAPALIAALPIGTTGATALVLGAGGSARAAVWALIDAGAAEVRVWNRTADRARRLCDELGATPATGAVDAIAGADILVNCTSAGLDGASPFDALPVTAAALERFRCVVDFVYAPGGSELVAQARARGVAAVDGLELLAGQGALSFERFTGVRPSTATMRAAAADGSYRPAA
jgi:shikimate dehydrogenase